MADGPPQAQVFQSIFQTTLKLSKIGPGRPKNHQLKAIFKGICNYNTLVFQALEELNAIFEIWHAARGDFLGPT